MTQIELVKSQLAELRQKINDGKIYQSLGTEVGAVIDNVKPTRLTRVFTPTDDDDFVKTLEELRTSAHDHELSEISDEEVLLMLAHLGSPDPRVRDRGVYFFFSELLEYQIISKEQLSLAFDYLSKDEMLFPHILEPHNNAAYQRTFSVLLLSTVLYADQAGYFFIEGARLNDFVLQFATYIALENDGRGFVKSNGWIHAYTHIGNVLDELTKREDLSRADKLFLMTVVVEKMKRIQDPLIYGETQRIAGFLANLANKNKLYSDYLLLLLKSWRSYLMTQFQPQTESDWNKIYNHGRLMQAIMLRSDFPEDISRYVVSGNDFFS